MSYYQLTQEQRYQISAWLKTGMSKTAIAQNLKVHKSTITRELSRNRGQRGYRAQQAQRLAMARHRQKRKHCITPDTWQRIEVLLIQDWSPEQICERLKLEEKPAASHESIYQYVYRDKAHGGELHTHLRCRRRRRKRYGTYSKRGLIPHRRSIQERPAVVETRSRIGDWEADTIVGKRHRRAILTLVERRSKFCLLKKLASRQAVETEQAAVGLLFPFKEQVFSITADNGKEFARHTAIAQRLETDFFFAHPYAAWERGTNENTNGLVRQYFPKQTDFSKITDKDVESVNAQLNNRPRKALGFRTPNEIFFKQKVALIT